MLSPEKKGLTPSLLLRESSGQRLIHFAMQQLTNNLQEKRLRRTYKIRVFKHELGNFTEVEERQNQLFARSTSEQVVPSALDRANSKIINRKQ